MKLTNCLITDNGITTIINGRPYQVGTDHVNYERILKTLKTKDADEFLRLYSPVSSISKIKETEDFKVTEGLVVGHGSVTYRGHAIHNVVANRIIAMQSEGHDIGPLTRFLEKALSLTSENLEALYLFMGSQGIPLDEEGFLLGWKVVKEDWTDKHSGTIDNRPGTKVPEIPRALCDSNRGNPCSVGYHVGNLKYSGPNGHFYSPSLKERIILVKFSPADVVSVPYDVHQDKIRVTQYEVVSEFVPEPEKEFKPESTFVNLNIKRLKPGRKIKFNFKNRELHFKFEGISKKSKGTKFFGRILKGSDDRFKAGSSASFLLSEVTQVEKL